MQSLCTLSQWQGYPANPAQAARMTRYSFIHLLTHSVAQSFVPLLTCFLLALSGPTSPPACSLTRPPTHSLFHLLAHPLTHPLTRSLTHSLSHSLARSLNCHCSNSLSFAHCCVQQRYMLDICHAAMWGNCFYTQIRVYELERALLICRCSIPSNGRP